MHPAPAFRPADPDFARQLVERVGFGMVFADTPDGLRVAHTPILWSGADRVQFHLSRANALARNLDARPALVVVNGPDAYISARWFAEAEQVSSWNYSAIELDGTPVRLGEAALEDFLVRLTALHEGRVTGGVPWTMDKLSPAKKAALLRGIVGFEMRIEAQRGTAKLSQNKSAADRALLADGLAMQGAHAMADAVRGIA